MSEEELFAFDLEGYLVVKGVLAPEEVATLHALAVRHCPGDATAPFQRTSGATAWGDASQALIDHPTIVPYLVEVLGPKFRLDHDFCVVTRTGGRDQDLHGGVSERNPDHWYRYRDGVIRCGLTVVSFALSAVRPGDGGFCCIPGSHKSNFIDHVPPDVRSYRRTPHYVVQPALDAGDAIIFTEALIHGTLPWAAEHERVALIYKYSPGHSAWMGTYYDPSRYPGLTERQRRILAPPSVGERPDSVGD